MNASKKEFFFNLPVVVVVVVGIVVTLFLYNLTSNTIDDIQKEKFNRIFERKTFSIQREIDLNLQVLQSLKSFYNASNFVDRDEFREFVGYFLKTHKSIQALEWIPRISKDKRKEYEQEAQKDLAREYKIKQKSPEGVMIESPHKNEYFPVYYVEPLAGNEKALGFDLSSSSVRLASLNEAIQKRKSTATSRIKLVQEEAKQFGFLLFMPIWEQLNKEHIKGFVLGVYRVGDMIKTTLQYDKESSLIDLWLLDTTDKTQYELLFTNTKIEKSVTSKHSFKIDMKGRTWTLFAKPSVEFTEKNSSVFPLIVLIIGFLLTILISYIVVLKAMKEKDLKLMVNEKTKSLLESNKKIEDLLFMFDKKVIASRTDKKGIITYATEAFCQISGYSKEELLGQNHRIVRHEDMSKEVYEELWNTISKGNIFTGEIKNKKKDGSSYWVDVTIFPELDDKKRIIGYFAIREDITAKKEVENFNKTLSFKVEEAVTQNQKKDQLLLQQSKLAAMGEMIGAIAHQWRQPLNTLAIQLQFIEDDFEDGLIDAKYLNEYSKESMKLVNFMSKTIDDFRNFFTVDKIKSNFDVKAKISDTTNMLSAQFEGHNIKLVFDGGSFVTIGHSSEFQQVILNIINNAKDALIEKKIEEGEITVEIECKDNVGYIIIKDNAGGIPQNVIDRVFEPYFTTKEEGKGTGLGLYMSKMIIEDNMDGKISVENITNGAQFTIELGVYYG